MDGITPQVLISAATALLAIGGAFGVQRFSAREHGRMLNQHAQDITALKGEQSALRELLQGTGGLVDRVRDQGEQLHEMRTDIGHVKTDVAVVRAIVEREMGRGSHAR